MKPRAVFSTVGDIDPLSCWGAGYRGEGRCLMKIGVDIRELEKRRQESGVACTILSPTALPPDLSTPFTCTATSTRSAACRSKCLPAPGRRRRDALVGSGSTGLTGHSGRPGSVSLTLRQGARRVAPAGHDHSRSALHAVSRIQQQAPASQECAAEADGALG